MTNGSVTHERPVIELAEVTFRRGERTILDSKHVSLAFDYPIQVGQHGRRWFARADSAA